MTVRSTRASSARSRRRAAWASTWSQSTRRRSRGPVARPATARILIDYLNGKLPVFVDVYISVVDIADTVAGHLLAAERGRAGARYVLNGATVQAREALDILTEITGVDRPVRMAPPPLARGVAAVSDAAARARAWACLYATRRDLPSDR